MYERHAEPPISARRFVSRLVRHVAYGVALVAASLGIGTAGFHWLAGQAPLDAFLNASMLLGGMGPVGDLGRVSPGGKLFAALFALYSGLVFLIFAGLLMAPIFHRILHRFHWDRTHGR